MRPRAAFETAGSVVARRRPLAAAASGHRGAAMIDPSGSDRRRPALTKTRDARPCSRRTRSRRPRPGGCRCWRGILTACCTCCRPNPRAWRGLLGAADQQTPLWAHRLPHCRQQLRRATGLRQQPRTGATRPPPPASAPQGWVAGGQLDGEAGPGPEYSLDQRHDPRSVRMDQCGGGGSSGRKAASA